MLIFYYVNNLYNIETLFSYIAWDHWNLKNNILISRILNIFEGHLGNKSCLDNALPEKKYFVANYP